ncbi:cobaltochelatase CobN [Bradyrhizobium sp. AZCC 1588]|uniref:cobaltochelatase subunit CobN n=1 Tax=unclassified Bradyrhizobium TaxID=2631580 RepID=UPI002FF3B203
MLNRIGFALNCLVAIVALVAFPSPATRAQDAPASRPVSHLRVITTDFVLPGRLDKLARLAKDAGLKLDHVYVEADAGDPKAWIAGVDLVILDTPRPMDLAKVQERIRTALTESRTPWIRVGGGPPGFGNLLPTEARRLIGYYSGGGESNLRAMFASLVAQGSSSIPAPTPIPQTGFYHPQAGALFKSVEDYLQWGADRWKEGAPRIAINIHPGLISGMETQVLDALVARSESLGLVPIPFWLDAADPEALQKSVGSAKPDLLIVATHMQNGRARRAEFASLNIPVVQTVSFREGDPEAWSVADTGMNSRLVATFLAQPESWGISDPMVIEAVRRGEPVPISPQVDALLHKAAQLSALRRKPAADKRLALMFWNYPPGEKNVSASNLNVPRSLERLTASLASAGYNVPAADEARLIKSAHAMMGALYHPERLPALRDEGLAATLPLARYRTWLDELPQRRREELLAHWGDPGAQPDVIEIAGEKHFVIPRLALGNLVIMPQPPRSGQPGADYHDTKQPPGHLYLATYLYLREAHGADALIHFGTHGTQEWTPGKDRGLSVDDYPYLAIGALPVFYPYIQDNVAEAIQAKRRGRAVTVSHQTPPFSPAGLYDELRDLHAKIHEHAQLDEGAVRDRVAAQLRKTVLAANMHRDMGWSEQRMQDDFAAFLAELHDHVHALADHAMPHGLHTFGEPASDEERVATVMQQLGTPFYRKLGADPKEFFAVDSSKLQDSPPYRLLRRHLRQGVSLDEVADPELRTMLERAMALDRHLVGTGEIEALLASLAGSFVSPGPGGDPIRNPDVPSGRNLFGFEPDKIPTREAYEAGGVALTQLLDAYRAEHGGEIPTKLAFSLWSGETMRHLGVMEAQAMHALGLRPVWDPGGRVVAMEIIPGAELGRARIDAVLQVTSVYRDQFDGFMRLLAGTIARLGTLDEAGNTIAHNTEAIAGRLTAQLGTAQARRLASMRMFSNAPGDYGTSLPGAILKSTAWEQDAPLAEAFLSRLQYAYGDKEWGTQIEGGNLFAEQLKGTQAAVLSRSSKLHGILSTDHPFEYLGGLSIAVRHLDGRSPSLYIANLREQNSRTTSAARFLADEMRSRYLNPHWIEGMRQEGYAGTLEILNVVNNFFGWQVTDPNTVRADQWQAMHDTFVRDVRNLDLAAWFETHNPTAQAQIVERMIEAIRKGYWDAAEQTRKELIQRWQELAARHDINLGEPETVAFIAKTAAGFGLNAAAGGAASNQPKSAEELADGSEPVRGPVLQPTPPAPAGADVGWRALLGAAFLFACFLAGAGVQTRTNRQMSTLGRGA